MSEPSNQQLLEAISGINNRLDGMDRRFDGLEGRFNKLDERFNKFEGRFAKLEGLVEGIAHTLTEIIVPNMATREDFAELSSKLDRHIADGPRLVW